MKRARQPDAGVVDEHVGVGAMRCQRRLDSRNRVGGRDVERQHDDVDLGLRRGYRAAACSSGSARRATSITSLPAPQTGAPARSRCPPSRRSPPSSAEAAKAASAAGSGRHQRRRQTGAVFGSVLPSCFGVRAPLSRPRPARTRASGGRASQNRACRLRNRAANSWRIWRASSTAISVCRAGGRYMLMRNFGICGSRSSSTTCR